MATLFLSKLDEDLSIVGLLGKGTSPDSRVTEQNEEGLAKRFVQKELIGL